MKTSRDHSSIGYIAVMSRNQPVEVCLKFLTKMKSHWP